MEPREDADDEGAGYFVFRYCAVCRSEFVAEDGQVPPYSWLHDHTTGEHRRPDQHLIDEDGD